MFTRVCISFQYIVAVLYRESWKVPPVKSGIIIQVRRCLFSWTDFFFLFFCVTSSSVASFFLVVNLYIPRLLIFADSESYSITSPAFHPIYVMIVSSDADLFLFLLLFLLLLLLESHTQSTRNAEGV